MYGSLSGSATTTLSNAQVSGLVGNIASIDAHPLPNTVLLNVDLNVALVANGNRVLLTQAGEQFLRHTERILREMETARAGLDTLTKWGHGRLRVGASTTACPALHKRPRSSFATRRA